MRASDQVLVLTGDLANARSRRAGRVAAIGCRDIVISRNRAVGPEKTNPDRPIPMIHGGGATPAVSDPLEKQPVSERCSVSRGLPRGTRMDIARTA
jgi:hypothetical protein